MFWDLAPLALPVEATSEGDAAWVTRMAALLPVHRRRCNQNS